MKYNISINDDDYLKFNIFYAYQSKGGKRSIRITQLVLPIFSVVFLSIFLLFSSDYAFILTEAVLLSALSVFWFFHAPKLLEKNVRKQLERLKKSGKLPYHPSSEIEFQDFRMVERYDQGEFRLDYADIENIYFENDSIYVFYTALQAFIIPYRCLGGDKDRVIALLMEKSR